MLRLPKLWKFLLSTCALALLGLCWCDLASADTQPPARPVETYTSEYEKSPHPNLVEQENLARWAQIEQDRYRVRVTLPDYTNPQQESSLETETNQNNQAGSARPPGGQPHESQTVAWVALL